jgi:hypothetical protein
MLEEIKGMLTLGDISVRAATGIEDVMLGRAKERDYEDINLLGEYLQSFLDKRNDYELLGGNPCKATLMWKTFGKNTNSHGQVALQTWFFRKRLDEVDNLTHEELTELFNTCMNLKRIALEVETMYPHSTGFAA